MVGVYRRYVEVEEEALREMVELLVDQTPLSPDEVDAFQQQLMNVQNARYRLFVTEEASILEMAGAR